MPKQFQIVKREVESRLLQNRLSARAAYIIKNGSPLPMTAAKLFFFEDAISCFAIASNLIRFIGCIG